MTRLNGTLQQHLEHLSRQKHKADEISDIFINAARENDTDLLLYMLKTPSLQPHLEECNSIRHIFKYIVSNGDLPLLQKIVQRPEIQNNNISYYLNLMFKEACATGNLDIVRYALTSPELTEHADIHYDQDDGLYNASVNGHLEIVQYLLTSPELSEHANIHANEYYAFRSASRKNHLNILTYMLTSPELKEHANVHILDDTILVESVFFGRRPTVEFLLSSPLLQEKANIHAQNDAPYRTACERNHTELIVYLLSFYTVNFQQTEFNLTWALNLANKTIIHAMVTSLQQDPMEHWKALAEFKKWCDFYGEQDFYLSTMMDSGQHYAEIPLSF